jgi:hypothetical protein
MLRNSIDRPLGLGSWTANASLIWEDWVKSEILAVTGRGKRTLLQWNRSNTEVEIHVLALVGGRDREVLLCWFGPLKWDWCLSSRNRYLQEWKIKSSSETERESIPADILRSMHYLLDLHQSNLSGERTKCISRVEFADLIILKWTENWSSEKVVE